MRATDIRCISANDNVEVGAEVTFETLPEGPLRVWFRFPRESRPDSLATLGDAFVSALLPIAMACGEPLHVSAAVSGTLFRSIPDIQAIYHTWEATMSKIDVVPNEVRPVSARNELPGVGLFFSLGVDSFYSLLRNLRGPGSGLISHLLLVRGFDISLDAAGDRLFDNCLRATHQIAQRYGKTAVSVTTNIRQLADRFVPWGRIYHGAALASVGLAMGGTLRKIYIASSYDVSNLRPWGSHPALDPLWSGGWTSFIHDACEVPRLEKVRFIAEDETALNFLRPCFENANSDYNCGCCDKCLQTMIYLHLVGALPSCHTLPSSTDLALFDRVRIVGTTADSPYWKECLAALERSEGESELTQAVSRYLARARQATAMPTTGMYGDWISLKRRVAQAIEQLPKPNGVIIVAGEDNVSRWMTSPEIRVCSFPHEAGVYWGTPSDDASALEQLDRACRAGAHYFVIDRECFWWLDYYSGFRDQLDERYEKVVTNDALMVFRLHAFDIEGLVTFANSHESADQ